jgi:adenosylcobinamide-GDP ribazoletransferase
LLGLLLVGLERGCSEVFPDYLSAAVLLVSLIVVNRGLHVDGLMDTCDGIFGGFTPERRLEIMRDSQVGAFGVAGAAGILLLKYGALVSLLGLSGSGIPGSGIQWSLLLFPMLSRWSMIVALGAFPYVRSQGLGSPFHQGGILWPTILAGLTAVVGAVLLGSIAGVGMLIGATLIAWVLGKSVAAKLGGLTGDSYGAINEVIEMLALMAVVAIASHGWVEPLTSFLDLT